MSYCNLERKQAVIPSAARDLARAWLDAFPGKIPRCARDDITLHSGSTFAVSPFRRFAVSPFRRFAVPP
jgi:hypothetical protein